MSINVNTNNQVIALDANQNIIITDSNIPNSINVTQPVTNVIEVISFGPRGSAGTSTTPGGSPTQIQFNNNGVLGGVPSLVFDGITLRATGSFSGSFTGQIISTGDMISNGNLIVSGAIILEPQIVPPTINPYGSIYFDGVDFFMGT